MAGAAAGGAVSDRISGRTMVKVRDEGHIQNKAIYVVLGVNLEGQKEVLGLWVAQTEGAKFWLQVLTELQNRASGNPFKPSTQSRPCIPAPRCSYASCIWRGPRSTMCPGKHASQWRPTCS